jgi:hypothetical protein
MSLIHRTRGRLAAASDLTGLGLWRGPGDHEGAFRLMLYHADAVKHIWEKVQPFSFLGPAEMLAHGAYTEDDHTMKGTMQLQDRQIPSAPAYEMTEIAALDDYGPMIFDLGLYAAGERGVVPDRNNLSPQAKRFLAAGKKTGKYELTRLPQGSRRYRGNWAWDSVWRLTPAETARIELLMGDLEDMHRQGFESIDWDAVQVPDLTRESYDDWMVLAYRTFFRARYHGTGRGRGLN